MRRVDLVGPKGYEHGWRFVGVPGVTPHADLLKARKEAREALPQGHPERLKAERAVRHSRKIATGGEEADWAARTEAATSVRHHVTRDVEPAKRDTSLPPHLMPVTPGEGPRHEARGLPSEVHVKRGASGNYQVFRGSEKLGIIIPQDDGTFSFEHKRGDQSHGYASVDQAALHLTQRHDSGQSIGGRGETLRSIGMPETRKGASPTGGRGFTTETLRQQEARRRAADEATLRNQAIEAQQRAQLGGMQAAAAGTIKPSPGGIFKATKKSGLSAFFDNEEEARKWLRGEPAVRHESNVSPYTNTGNRRRYRKYANEPESVVEGFGPNPAISFSAETPILSVKHAPIGKPGGPGLWGVKGMQLPAYIQNIRNALIRGGMSEGKATGTAINMCYKLSVKSKHPEVKAAAAKAIAELKVLQARAHSEHSNEPANRVIELFNPYHAPAGSPAGGQFTAKSGGQSQSEGTKQTRSKPPARRPSTPGGPQQGKASHRSERKRALLGQAKALRAKANVLETELHGLEHQLNARRSTSHGGSKATGTTRKLKKHGKTAPAKSTTQKVKAGAKRTAKTTAKAAGPTLRGRIGNLRRQIAQLRIQAAHLVMRASAL